MNACFSQSTSISEIITVKTGYEKRNKKEKKRGLMSEEMVHTYVIIHSMLLPLNHPKLFGKKKPTVKSKSVPLSSMRLRKATIKSINARVKRSTISNVPISSCRGQLIFGSFLPAQVI